MSAQGGPDRPFDLSVLFSNWSQVLAALSALVRQRGGLGNSVESFNISYGKPRYRVELFGKLLDGPGFIWIELEVGSA